MYYITLQIIQTNSIIHILFGNIVSSRGLILSQWYQHCRLTMKLVPCYDLVIPREKIYYMYFVV